MSKATIVVYDGRKDYYLYEFKTIVNDFYFGVTKGVSSSILGTQEFVLGTQFFWKRTDRE